MRALACALSLLAATAGAEPWAAPGEVSLRHDLQLLVDLGLLAGPVLSWPIGWLQLAREIDSIDSSTLSPGVRAAVARVAARAARESRSDDIDAEVYLAAAAEPDQLRTFAATPREEGEGRVAAHRHGERISWKLSATLAADPDDDREFRADGSYVAASLGNWIVSAGYTDRWWGPGWQGSLILSNNARPLPAIAVDRNESLPFDLPVLRWLGPWRLSSFMGRFESDRDHPNALLFGLRVEFRPHPTLQLAASRSAQWCGEGRPCNAGTFWDLLSGNDNDQQPDEQPGNQLAGFDLRWSWPGGRVPIAVYAQAIGEDEAGLLPSKHLGLFGVESWWEAADGSWRAHVEYADSACDFLSDPPEFGCAYTNSIYYSGYRYRGRAVGHSMDADGESIGLGVLYIDGRGWRWDLLARNVKINRAGAAPEHSLADAPARVRDLTLSHEAAHRWGILGLSLGYADVDATGQVAVAEGLRGFVTWRREIH